MGFFNKLVRDRIVEMIEESGRHCTYRVLGPEEYVQELKVKLQEEVREFLEAEGKKEAVEELADVLEVVFALAGVKGATVEELMAVREAKAQERGGFGKRVFLQEIAKDTTSERE